ncbi:MAG: hydantoinase/oxoprolinase family protein [Solirubrobacteraceae bacterium]|nr:hydantoinase/oxoprolinase family protein [Solirubrobacteraceae bacterium]
MRVGCDVGGTFTDLVALDEDGVLRLGKALNSGTGPAEGTVTALRAAGGDPSEVTEFSHGTTTVTNLLIERTGAQVGLLCTRGFRDILEIQWSFREQTFAAHYAKEPALVPRHRRLEIGGRIERDGTESEPLDLGEVAAACRALVADGAEVLAISLYNAYANPAHERAVAAVWREVAPGRPVTTATDVDSRIGEYERASTATLNASAVPAMRAYAEELRGAIDAPTLYMHSAGGVVTPPDAAERPIQLAFSGPAAGVLAARQVARELGLRDVITLDMGGTSCDVCLIRDGELRERDTFEVAFGVPARMRSIDISTVGAGGGSIGWMDTGGALQVGPRSAGALPGPACYGRGGTEPTVTDANLVLGVLGDGGLLGGTLALDIGAAETALAALGEQFGVDAVETARAMHAAVNANMAQAVRQVTVRHGIDPRTCALIAFGGAGGQHATGVAAELDLGTVVIPAHSSVLSAVGLLTADVRVTETRTLLAPVETIGTPEVDAVFAELRSEAAARLEGADVPELLTEEWVGLRYADQWHELALPVAGDPASLAERFETEHEQRFGTRLADPVQVVDCWVVLAGARTGIAIGAAATEAPPVGTGTTRELRLFDAMVDVVTRDDLGAEGRPGPLLVEEGSTVTVVPPGRNASMRTGHLVLEIEA